jgi:GNAT superfamily N-acetyltransferase
MLQVRRERMSMEEYHRLPFHPGWKVEYIDGEAWFQVREAMAVGVLPVTRSDDTAAGVHFRAPAADDAGALIAGFREAFEDSVEYCGWTREKFDAEAEKTVRAFFAGKRGAPCAASRVAVAGPGGKDDGARIGAALVVRGRNDEPFLSVLWVAPSWRRRGVATAMLGSVRNALHDLGCTSLATAWMLACEASDGWHRCNGFVEQPDLFNARLYHRRAAHELRRLGELGQLTDAARAKLEAERDHWAAETERLESLLDTEGKEGAFALWRIPH